jgi:Uma2 family endonuclease
MGMPLLDQPRWTAKAVRQLMAEAPLASPRYEVVDGELLVTPSPPHPHQMAVTLLLVALSNYLDVEPVAVSCVSPSDIELEPDHVVQPDVYVVTREEAGRLAVEGFPGRSLLVAAEVVSPSSGRYDRVKKRPLYLRHVSEYWIVDTDARLVERWRPAEDRPEILTDTLTWHPTGATTAFRLDLAVFFDRIARGM